MALQDPNIMPSSRLDCPLSLKTPNMGNTGLPARACSSACVCHRQMPVEACESFWYTTRVNRNPSSLVNRRHVLCNLLIMPGLRTVALAAAGIAEYGCSPMGAGLGT